MSNLHTSHHFSSLARELAIRAARAVLSQIGFTSEPLRRHLRQIFERSPGEAGSFLADPVFEGLFPWETDDCFMSDLSGSLLHPNLIDAMDKPPESLRDYRFEASWHPYRHQVEAWTILRHNDPRSVLITSGTGSGKTECFLVPILDDLVCERSRMGRLVGVRALFLYPLNALINSQRDRLRAWTAFFSGDLRFCLYNGETPEEFPAAKQRVAPEEVLSRKILREEPPPILVTNATMLEYMLVRNIDAPILNASRGNLRWIVLDEAHTYAGSQAAELALLLRRVMQSFNVEAANLRFVATSATITDVAGNNTLAELQTFLADVAGIAPDQVHVIEGRRRVPELAETAERRNDALPNVDRLEKLDPASRFERLASNAPLRAIRALLGGEAVRLSAIANLLASRDAEALCTVDESRRALQILDVGTTAIREGGAFLPLRGHFFHRTQSGLWACCNAACTGRQNTPLEDKAWPFGKLFLERRAHCDTCASLVFDLVVCTECGTEYLACEEGIDAACGRHLRPRTYGTDYDEFQEEFESIDADDETGDADPETDTRGLPRLIAPRGWQGVDRVAVDPSTGAFDSSLSASLALGLVTPEPGGGLPCLRCGSRERRRAEVFRPARVGAPFCLSVAIPALLEHTPPLGGEAFGRPFEGRRLITFSDSRQGTARFAVKAQLDAERNHVRSVLYHYLASRREEVGANVERIRAEVEELERATKASSILKPVLDQRRRDLDQALAGRIGQANWADALKGLQNDIAVREWLPDQWYELALGEIPRAQVAEYCLYREFFRRPRRLNSLETLGLIAIRYLRIERLTDSATPAVWRQIGKPADHWRAFLKLTLDFYVRAYSAVDIPTDFIRWLGVRVRKTYLIGPDATPSGRNQRLWPLIRGPGRRSRLVNLLLAYLQLDPGDAEARSTVNELLYEAWETIAPMLKSYPDGRLLDLAPEASLTEVHEAWLCPVTRRILDTTLDGLTPYLPPALDPSLSRCRAIEMPKLPKAYWQEARGQRASGDEITHWLEHDPGVHQARELGIWTEFSDRIASFAPYFRVVEHSAQQSGALLRGYEERFKAGKVNVLSCSTTMEMGVDIGGLAAVAMNNPPPSPANFLQRAGRAGRRGESTATSLTLCKSTPHGEAVFRNPLWPFATPLFIPRVSLQSERIVQRHVNAVALTRFLALRAGNGQGHRLTTGSFFVREAPEVPSLAERFRGWCQNSVEIEADEVSGMVVKLVRRTAFDGIDAARLLGETATQLDCLIDRWTEERDALLAALELVRTGASDARKSPASIAIERQLERLTGEYLLGELAAKAFLPGYGFPTNVVCFIPTTAAELLRRRQRHTKPGDGASTYGREDSFAIRRGYPSRDLATAIREYAPGAEVILDGRVYRSDGVTLNWHLPPGDQEVHEVQAFRWVWHCKSCGATGTRPSRVSTCPARDCLSQNLVQHEYLRPAGFAVDIRYEPHNDISTPTYVPVRDAFITVAGAPWLSLPQGEYGRYRYSADGHVFHWNTGLHGHGYAVCLRCGRANSEITADGPELWPGMENHPRLRGGRGDSGSDTRCTGNDEDRAIKRRVWLGVESFTDVFELQIIDPDLGSAVPDKVTAYSIAVALTQAFAEKLGVSDREIGGATAQSTTQTGAVTWSIFLYDTAVGGAGYVSNVGQALPSLLRHARDILQCARECDKACHTCLLTFDTEHHIDDLDRRAALRFLTPALLNSMDLPTELGFFGGDSRFEFDAIANAIRREVQHPDVDELRLYLGGEAGLWDIMDWPLTDDVLRWAGKGLRIRLCIAEAVLPSLETAARNTLAGMVEISEVEVRSVPEQTVEASLRGRLLAELGTVQRSIQWAVSADTSCAPGPSWGRNVAGERCVRCFTNHPLPPLRGTVLGASALRQSHEGTVNEIQVRRELDGPAGQFGSRFWERIRAQSPMLAGALSSSQELAEVRYADRYLRSPIAIRLFLSVIRALSPELGVREGTMVTVLTARLEHGIGRSPTRVSHDWLQDGDRRQVFDVLASRMHLKATLRGSERRDLPHARELTLKWRDGRCCTLRLDQGFGYWWSAVNPPFPFERLPEQQAEALWKMDLTVQAQNPKHPTIVYVGSIQG